MGGRLRTAPRAGLLVAAVFVTLAGVVASPGAAGGAAPLEQAAAPPIFGDVVDPVPSLDGVGVSVPAGGSASVVAHATVNR